MTRSTRRPLLALGCCLALAPLARADDKAPTYKDDIAPIFNARCNACHNNDKKKGGLVLDTFGATMQGGSSGAIVEAGDPDNSRLFTLVDHTEEPKMPPGGSKIPDPEIARIRKWIELGAPEASGSAVAMKAKPKLEFKLDPAAIGKPKGEPALPANLSTEPVVVSPRPNAITALAHSPWAPLVAVAGHRQVILYHTQTRQLLAVLPFPEGVVEALKFTPDGDLLLAGGGRGGQSGRVVVWDVKTGERAFEIGKEYDTVLAADISPDRSLVALGGPSKTLKVYGTADGELVYESKKHTEWVTAVAFSPDGVLLASGDRNGGLIVWEAPNGREFYDLRGHQVMVADLAWRLDSNVLASAAEDGTARLWNMVDGKQAKNWPAHGGGAASVRFAKDGRIVTAGRDRVVKVWDANGANPKPLEAFPDIALKAVFTHDEAAVVAGDFSGEVRIYNLADGKRTGNLAANPPTVAARLEAIAPRVAAAEAAVADAAKAQQAAQAAADARAADAAKAQQALAAAQTLANEAKAKADANAADLNARGKVEAAAIAAANSANDERTRVVARRDAALADHKAKAAAVTAAAATVAQTKMDRDRQLLAEAVAVLDAATKEIAARLPEWTAAIDAANAARSQADRATADRLAAEVARPLASQRSAEAAATLAAGQAGLAAVQQAQQAAAAAVAAEVAKVQAAQASLDALKAERDALNRELQAKALASGTGPAQDGADRE